MRLWPSARPVPQDAPEGRGAGLAASGARAIPSFPCRCWCGGAQGPGLWLPGLCTLCSMWMWAGLLVGFAQVCLGHVALGDECPSGLVLVEGGHLDVMSTEAL